MHRWPLLLLLTGCGGDGLGLGSSVDGQVLGAIEEFKAKWTMSPTACYSGERASFLGVDLIEGEDEDTLVRIVSDPVDGYSVGTNIPGEDASLFVSAADMCETFDVEVTRTNTRVNNIWNVEGHAVVDCVAPGLTFRVDVNFSGCH
jgi:hypothetical protein